MKPVQHLPLVLARIAGAAVSCAEQGAIWRNASPQSLVESPHIAADVCEQFYPRLRAMSAAETITSPNQTLSERLSAGGEPLYLKINRHCKSAGNRLATKTIYSRIRSARKNPLIFDTSADKILSAPQGLKITNNTNKSMAGMEKHKIISAIHLLVLCVIKLF